MTPREQAAEQFDMVDAATYRRCNEARLRALASLALAAEDSAGRDEIERKLRDDNRRLVKCLEALCVARKRRWYDGEWTAALELLAEIAQEGKS